MHYQPYNPGGEPRFVKPAWLPLVLALFVPFAQPGLLLPAADGRGRGGKGQVERGGAS